MMLCCLGAPILAGEVHPDPDTVKSRQLSEFVESKCSFALESRYFWFEPGGRYSGSGPSGEKMRGKWHVEGQDLVVEATGKGGHCDKLEADCDETWPASFVWRGLRTNGTSILTLENGPRGEMVYLCTPGPGCVVGTGTRCFPAEGIRLRPGSWDRRLYWSAWRQLRETGIEGAVIVRGPPPEEPRQTSEIWYQEGAEERAKQVAAQLEPLLGSLEPRKWRWGGAYRVIIIVGRKRIE